MKTDATRLFDIELPIFAFTHCRDVVVEVSKAGGMGILGIAGFTAEQVEQELRWIDEHIDDKPYGVDLLIPSTYEDVGTEKQDLNRLLPASHRNFVRKLADDAGMPPLPQQLLAEEAHAINATPQEGQLLLEVALRHPVKLVVNALGTPQREQVRALQARGIRVASLIGNAAHARAQVDAGVDMIIAQGTEAGGHTGKIASMVLWPQIVDLVHPLPVLAAGGIGRGRQMAAALALGAAGVWCGSIWLGTRESEVLPALKERLFAAQSEDAVQTRSLTGKPCRALKSKYTEAWEHADAPEMLPMPLQMLLWLEPRRRAERGNFKDWMSYPVGQIVGDMHGETSVRQVIREMLEELAEASERLGNLMGTDE